MEYLAHNISPVCPRVLATLLYDCNQANIPSVLPKTMTRRRRRNTKTLVKALCFRRKRKKTSIGKSKYTDEKKKEKKRRSVAKLFTLPTNSIEWQFQSSLRYTQTQQAYRVNVVER